MITLERQAYMAAYRAKNKERLYARAAILRRRPDQKAKKLVYDKAYQLENKEKLAAQSKLYYQQNRLKFLTLNQAWREAHPDKMKDYKRVWYEKNWEELQGRNKKWALLNPERVKTIKKRWKQAHLIEERLHCQARRAKTKNNVVKEEIKNWYSRICGICGEAIEADFHIDHIIPLSMGGVHAVANLQLAHPVCNMRKGNRIVRY